jgi:G:T/U-mismatch repair DNA glycosylase
MTEEWTIEEHPNWYRDVSPMRFLILGSFPPHHSKRIYPFFYPNARNRFWKILAELAGEPLQWTQVDSVKAVEERYCIMEKLQAGVQNLGLEVKRKGRSALDTNIEITKFHDVISIIEAHPELVRILLPGFSAKHSTARSFLRFIRQAGVVISEDPEIKPGSSFTITVKGRPRECVILNSTSTASRVTYDFLLEQFARHLM